MTLLLLLGGEEGVGVDPGRNALEAVVAVSGDVYVAPVGTPLPELVRADLDAAFFRIGLVSEDGVALAVAPDIEQHDAWQHSNPIRYELAQQRIAVTFDMLQWNAEIVVWAFGGHGVIQEFVPGQWRYDFPADDQNVDERSIVIDWEDGDKPFRLVFARGTVLGGLSTTLRRGAMATLPIGFDCLAVDESGSPGYLFLSASASTGGGGGEEEPPPPPPGDLDELGEGFLGEGDLGG